MQYSQDAGVCGTACQTEPPDVVALRDTAVLAAERAGKIQMDRFRMRNRVVTHRSHDLTLATDWKSERAIISTISQRFPDHGFLSEEYGLIQGFSEYYWIVDPLDGSVNYCPGLPHFAVSIACYRKEGDKLPLEALPGSPVLAIVYLPFYQELYEAVANKPALCNNRPLAVSKETKLSNAIIALSFGSQEATMQRMEKINTGLLRKVRKVRMMGATAADLVNVAGGRCSGLVQLSVKAWDFAAAAVILKQAGGCFAASRIGQCQWRIAAGAPGIFDEFMQALDFDTIGPSAGTASLPEGTVY